MRLPWRKEGVKGPESASSVDSEPTTSAESEVGAKKGPRGPLRVGEKKAKALCDLVDQRFTEAQDARKPFESQWALALAFHEGHQWYRWDPNRGMVDIRDKDDRTWYRTANLIRPLAAVACARITSNRPDVTILPLSQDRELDKAAAQELRMAVEDCNIRHQDRLLLAELARYAWIATTAFDEIYWDPDAEADVPVEWDESGQPARYEKARVGAICERVRPGHEIFPDPRSQRWHDSWIIDVQVMGIGEIERIWGQVVPTDNAAKGIFGSLVEALVAPWSSREKGKIATVKRMYEPPTKAYPQGRVVVVCQDRLLEYREELPPGGIPLLPVGYSKAQGTPYHQGPGVDLTGPQFDYNLLRSRWLGSLRDLKLTEVRMKGDGGGADQSDDLFQDNEAMHDETPRVRTVWYRRGFAPPTITLPPPLPASDFTLALQELREEMREIGGVHQVSTGAGDPNAKSGISIRLLKDSDESAGAEFAHEFEVFLERRARLIGELARTYVKEPRAWQLDDKSNPGQAKTVYSGLDALRAGGMAAVRVAEGSATPRTPEAEDQQVMDLFGAGVLGPIDAPETAELVLSLLHAPIASRALEARQKAMEEAQTKQVIEGQISEALDGQEMGSGSEMEGVGPEMGPGGPEMGVAGPSTGAPLLTLDDFAPGSPKNPTPLGV